MNAALRLALKRRVDQAVRAQIDWLAEARCCHCQVELFRDDGSPTPPVIGCKACSDRHSKIRQRRRAAQLVLIGEEAPC